MFPYGCVNFRCVLPPFVIYSVYFYCRGDIVYRKVMLFQVHFHSTGSIYSVFLGSVQNDVICCCGSTVELLNICLCLIINLNFFGNEKCVDSVFMLIL